MQGPSRPRASSLFVSAAGAAREVQLPTGGPVLPPTTQTSPARPSLLAKVRELRKRSSATARVPRSQMRISKSEPPSATTADVAIVPPPPVRASKRRSSVFSASSVSEQPAADETHLSSCDFHAPPAVLSAENFSKYVQRVEMGVPELLREGQVTTALTKLKELIEGIQDRQRDIARRVTKTGKAASASIGVDQPSRWCAIAMQRLAVMHTAVANNVAVRSSAAAEALPLQEAYFQAAMRYLWCNAKEAEEPGVKNRRAKDSANSAPTSHSSRHHVHLVYPSCFSSDSSGYADALLCLLRGTVRSNAAVCLGDRATYGGQCHVVYELLRALADAHGWWSMATLYNLAVAFLGLERYDDAAEAVARCMELSLYYLDQIESFCHESRTDFTLSEREALMIRAHMAQHLIRGHHFIASMAAWCEPAGPLEMYHCDLALRCARHCLAATDGKQRECRRRLKAARRRAEVSSKNRKGSRLSGGAAAASPPPWLTFVTEELYLSNASALTHVPPLLGSDHESGAVSLTRVADLLYALSTASAFSNTSTAVCVPTEVHAYLEDVKSGKAMRYWAQEAEESGGALNVRKRSGGRVFCGVVSVRQSIDENNRCGNVQSRGGRTVRSIDDHAVLEMPGAVAAKAAARSLCATDDERASSVTGAGWSTSPSKPAPLFVTTLPESTLHRYLSLRNSIVTRLEDAEARTPDDVAVQNDNATWTTSAAGAVQPCRDNAVAAAATTDTACEDGTARPSINASAAQRRRLTALLYGAATTENAEDGHAAAPPTWPGEGRRVILTAEGLDERAYSASTTVLAVLVRPSELLRQLDTETAALYSRLVGDPLADVRRTAATKLQAQWRSWRARKQRQQRTSAVTQRRQQDAKAYVIQCVYRKWRERKPDVIRLRKLRSEHHKEQRVIVVQAFLRQHASLSLCGRLYVELCERLVEEQRETAHSDAAAVTLQSWWRMCRAQTSLRHKMQVVARLQRSWRCYLAREELWKRRVRRRLEREEWWRCRMTQIHVVQRWWRACKARHAARAMVGQKQDAVHAYLAVSRETYDTAIKSHSWHVGEEDGVADLGAALRRIISVLAGAQDRRRLGWRLHHAQVRERVLTRHVLRKRGAAELQRRRQERHSFLTVQKRREEVDMAVRRLQTWVRAWPAQHRSAPRRCTGGDASAPSHRSMAAATRIQATWRMHHAQKQVREYQHFMNVDRHRYAATIQRTWRGHRARTTQAAPWREMKKEVPGSLSRHETQSKAPHKPLEPPVHATHRKSLVSTAEPHSKDDDEKHVQDDAHHRTRPNLCKFDSDPTTTTATTAASSVAATTIKAATWRSILSISHTGTATDAPLDAHVDSVTLPSLSHLTDSTDVPLHVLFNNSAQNLQRAGGGDTAPKPYVPYSTASERSISSSYKEDESVEAEGEARDSSATRSSQMGQDSGAGETKVSATHSGSLVCHQASPSSSSERQQIVCGDKCQHTVKEAAAAVQIQALWRGYCIRCTYEFYYEEYYEEIDGDADEESGEDADGGH